MNFVRKVYLTLRGVAEHPMHKNQRFKSVLHFCTAQVAARFVPGDICVSFPNQTFLLVPPRMKGAAHFIFPRLPEFDTMAFVMHFLRPGDLFVDVGANIGAYTVLASGVAGAKSISFEPSPSSFQSLKRSVFLNNLSGKVDLHQAALARVEGPIRVTQGLGTENHVSTGNGPSTVEVPATTLDKVLGERKPILIKIDVEGFESEVLGGAEQTLMSTSLQGLIIERSGAGNQYGFDESALHAGLRAKGFRPMFYCPAQRKLAPLSEESIGNILYVRNLEDVNARTRSAETFQIGDFKV